MQKYRMLKLVGMAVLTMVVLVAMSFIEVAIYAYLINPGHDEAFYEAYAQVSAPWVSGIGGLFWFFFVVRRWGKKQNPDLLLLALLFPLTYVILDVVVLLLIGGVQWGEFYWVFLLANGAKLAGSLAGYGLTTRMGGEGDRTEK